MAFKEGRKIFNDYVQSRGLKQGDQSREILWSFLKTEKHLTADEAHDPQIEKLQDKLVKAHGFSISSH
jgi:Fe2+ or Zn2+ uptake regulation protein